MASRRLSSVLILYALFAALLFLTHHRLLDLPFFWDEAGQFIPQAHDLYSRGLLVPQSAAPNSHPPGLPIALAALWQITGYSIMATRAFMLMIAAAFLTAAFLLAIELLKGLRGAPAFLAAALLLSSPLLYTQSMMAQLDLPSALFTTILMLAFLQRRESLAVMAAVLAVAFKETSIAIPLTLAFFAWRDGHKRFASLLALAPALLLANWFGFMLLKTGHLFGDAGYAQYNLFFPLHPLRLSYALLRRIAYLFVENVHIVPALILAWRWQRIGFQTIWQPIAWACAVQALFVSITGGAVLERYLLPVLPVLYAAFAAGLSTLSSKRMYTATALTAAGLLAGLFINPPWPYPLENNLAMVDFVELERDAAGLAEAKFANNRITTAWPLTDALRKPVLGFVQTPPRDIRAIEDFSLERLQALDWRSGDILILYSRGWDPRFGLGHLPWVREMRRRFFAQPAEASLGDLTVMPQLKPLIGYERRGLWVEILYVPSP